MRKARRTRAVVATAALGGTLLLAGCGQADTAVIIDGQRISEQATLEATAQINEAFSETLQQPLTTDVVLSQLIAAPFVNEVADEAGVGTAESAARSAMPNLADPSEETIRLVRANFALQQLGADQQAQVLQDLAAASISVNPRYGRFDASSLGLTPGSPNWITASPEGSEPDGAGEPEPAPGG